MLEKQIEFKSSADVFDAGYAIMTANFNVTDFNWRFRNDSFVTRVVDYEIICVNGNCVPVFPITELERRK